MSIEDIVKKRALQKAVLKANEKEFLKDCYLCWKEYKQVEKPYTWWLFFLTLEHLFDINGCFFWWIKYIAPTEYLDESWFSKKWSYESIGYHYKITNIERNFVFHIQQM